MVGFFIKKAFFDGWDNLISLILLNLGYVAILGLGYLVLNAMEQSLLLGFFTLVVWVVIFQVYSGAVSFFSTHLVFYKRPEIRELLEEGKRALKYVPLISAISVMLIMVAFLVMPFYLASPGLFSLFSASLIFWASIFMSMVLMYYFPVASQLKDRPAKVLKKSSLIVLDNFGFSFFLLFYTAINSVLSILTAFLIPGYASILMSHQVALRLRMFKYDYLEEHPNTSRRDIPWDALLFDEREKVGPRSIRGMIFPWKD